MMTSISILVCRTVLREAVMITLKVSFRSIAAKTKVSAAATPTISVGLAIPP